MNSFDIEVIGVADGDAKAVYELMLANQCTMLTSRDPSSSEIRYDDATYSYEGELDRDDLHKKLSEEMKARGVKGKIVVN